MRTCSELLYPHDQKNDDSQPPASEASSKYVSTIADEIESLELELVLKALRE